MAGKLRIAVHAAGIGYQDGLLVAGNYGLRPDFPFAPAEIVDKANAFREAGVTHLLGLYFAANSGQELIDQMQIFGEEVTPRVK